MGLAIGGVVANFFGFLLTILNVTSQGESFPAGIFIAVVGVLWAVSLLGLILAAAGNQKVGGILIMVGSAIFVPLGLIGLIGGRKVMHAGTANLDARRRLGIAAGNSQSVAGE